MTAPLSVELLVELVQTVHVTLGLSRDGADLEANATILDTLLQVLNRGDTNVLERVLDASLEIGDEFGDGTTVKNGATKRYNQS